MPKKKTSDPALSPPYQCASCPFSTSRKSEAERHRSQTGHAVAARLDRYSEAALAGLQLVEARLEDLPAELQSVGLHMANAGNEDHGAPVDLAAVVRVVLKDVQRLVERLKAHADVPRTARPGASAPRGLAYACSACSFRTASVDEADTHERDAGTAHAVMLVRRGGQS